MTTKKVTYNFTLRNETIENVAKNTFNDYDIDDIINIELLCDNYELCIYFKSKSHQFFEDNIIYQQH